MIRCTTTTVRATAMTTASAPAGAPVRRDASPRRRDANPSRPSAKRIREPAVAVPSPLANALIVAPRLIRSARALPTYLLDRSPRGDEEAPNAVTPAALVPKPQAW